MPYILDIKDFITRFINNCSIVKSSCLDKTIKAIINSYLKKNSEEKYNSLINYLNKIRVIYYLKRLEYRDSNKAKELKGKLTNFSI